MDRELKRRKKAISATEDEGDRISRLSDDLIHIIMSFLDIKLAVQTCVLSKRWKLVWTTLPYLKFRSYDYNSPKYCSLQTTTPKFVGKFLKHRNHRSQVSSLKLMLLTPCIFSRFVKYAISHRVQYLKVHSPKGPEKLSIFNSDSIVILKLKMKIQDIVLESDCWDLPNLTTLHLTRRHYDHSHMFPELCLTCLPALTTLCLTDWDLEKSSFSFSLPAITTLRLSNCKLPKVVWNFPALKSLALHDVVFPDNIKDIFAALVRLKNLTLFFYKNSVYFCVLPCPQLVNLEIRTRYHHKNGIYSCVIDVVAPKLRTYTSVGISSISFRESELHNVYVKLKGWIDHMILPRELLKTYYYRKFKPILSNFSSAKILYLDLEAIEALSSITDRLVRFRSPFRNLQYVKLPLGCKEENICSTLRSYLLGGSPAATIVAAWPQKNVIPNAPAQNVVIQEPLVAPTKLLFVSENIHKTVCIDTVDIGVQEQDVAQNSEVIPDRARHVDGPVEGSDNDRAISSKRNNDFGIWRGHEVNSEFACLLNLIVNKYPETFEHFTTTDKKLSTMKLNMLCTTVNVFTKISMTQVNTAMIAEYRDVFAGLQKFGFGLSWLVSRLNYIEKLRFSQPLLSELHEIDCHINSAKSKLQELETNRVEKMQEIQKAFGTMGANLDVACIGDDLLRAL